LQTIANTSGRQLQLQRTVEGLSAIAISYYLLGILGYALTGMDELIHLPKALLTLLALPIVVGTAWLVSRGMRQNRLHGDESEV
jgi:uncharacterized membrane-anchored protein